MNFWIVALVVASGCLIGLHIRRRLACRKRNPAARSDTQSSPPVADAMPLGPGITMIVPRALSVKMPRILGGGKTSYAAAVRELFAEFFGPITPDQDRAWQEWLNLTGRHPEPSDLTELMEGNVRDEFKARALVIRLLPALRFSPFSWKDSGGLQSYLSLGSIRIAKFSGKLRAFAIELIRLNVDFILATQYNEKLYAGLNIYNNFILQILAFLPEDDPKAAELFDRYRLNDPNGFSDMEDASGYNPFGNLLRAQIPSRWKRLADQKMREIVTAEEAGNAMPRYEWEKALECYAEKIQFCLCTDPFPYDTELFASQLEFVLQLPRTEGRKIIDHYRFPRTLAVLSGEDKKDLRRRLARRVMLANRPEYERFRITDKDSWGVVASLLNEFGEEDKELCERLLDLIREARTREEEARRAANLSRARTDAVLGKMR